MKVFFILGLFMFSFVFGGEEEKRLFTGEKMDAYRLKVAKSIIAIKAKLN